MKINHFPNISLDISETKEKYLTEKNEEIIEELCQILVEHSKIESDIFLKHQEINTYKKENRAHAYPTGDPGDGRWLTEKLKKTSAPRGEKNVEVLTKTKHSTDQRRVRIINRRQGTRR